MCVASAFAENQASVSAGEKFPATVDRMVGLHVHLLKLKENEWAQLEATGIRVARVDLFWSEVERKPGVYNWDFYDDMVKKLVERNIRPLFVLGFPNKIYSPSVSRTINGKEVPFTQAPQTPEAIEAYARWAAEAVGRYNKHNPIWEIWNEPETPQFWPPKGDVEAYIRMANPVVDAIRKKQPTAIIIAPSMSAVPNWHYHSEFMPAVLGSELGRKIDAISIHPYRNAAPETVLENMDLLNGYIREALPDRVGSLHYFFSEWGYSTAKGARTEEMQAAYLVRQLLVGQMVGARVTIWYDWRDDGDNPDNREHRFGITRRNGEPKPAYYAFTTILSELKGFQYEKRISLPDEHNYVLLFVNQQGKRKLVAWNNHDGGGDNLPREYQAVGDGRDIAGNPVALKIENSQIKLELTPSPIYITLL